MQWNSIDRFNSKLLFINYKFVQVINLLHINFSNKYTVKSYICFVIKDR